MVMNSEGYYLDSNPHTTMELAGRLLPSVPTPGGGGWVGRHLLFDRQGPEGLVLGTAASFFPSK